MNILKNERETILKPENQSALDFFSDFKKKYTTFIDDNIIIDFSDFKGVNTENILLFLQHSKTSRDNGMSFVIVVNGIDIDSLPENINIVPTIAEAKDIIEMEKIERDLGF